MSNGVSRYRNAVLAALMAEYGLTRAGLADLVNDRIEENTGEPGEATERWVYYLLSGQILWPREAQRQALEEVFGVSALDLGFIPPRGARRRSGPTLRVVRAPKGEAVDRRRFFMVAGAGALSITLPDLTRRTRLGMSDVETLRQPLRELVTLDDRRGGTTLAPAAAGVVRHIEQALERCEVSDRVRRAFYTLSGEYLGNAGWFAIDADDLPAAARYLDHALRVATISRDATLQAQIWNGMAWRATQAGDHAEGMAIAQAALTSTASRRNPKIAALWHGWVAQGHAWRGQRALAERSLGRAHDALDRADDGPPTPSWLTFLDRDELSSQAAYSHLVLGNYAAAEDTAAEAIAATAPAYPRNRVSRQLTLAHAYLGQREVEQAVNVASTALDLTGDLHSGRLLRRYHTLHDRMAVWESDVPAAAAWTQRFRAQVPAS